MQKNELHSIYKYKVGIGSRIKCRSKLYKISREKIGENINGLSLASIC